MSAHWAASTRRWTSAETLVPSPPIIHAAANAGHCSPMRRSPPQDYTVERGAGPQAPVLSANHTCDVRPRVAYNTSLLQLVVRPRVPHRPTPRGLG